MNRKLLASRLSACLLDLIETGNATRGGVAEAADTSETTARSWVDGQRLPDLHDVHLLAVHAPAIGLRLLSLVTDGTTLGVDYAPVVTVNGTLSDAVAASIDLTARASALAKAMQEAAQGGRTLAASESAHLHGIMQELTETLAMLRGLTTKNTSRSG